MRAVGAHTSFQYKHSRAAFTLFELLLVLVVLSVVAAMVVPTLGRAMSTRPLRAAADDLRQLLTEVRRDAIDAGVPLKFEYVPGQREYSVAVLYETADLASTGTENGQPMAATVIASLGERTLPDGISFVEERSSTLGGIEQYLVVFFYPDGSADDSMLAIQDADERSMEITVRGLTGAVSIGKIQQERDR
ncbi:prepilin-type N-terminal cleavage/methylation domain-containing protein [Calycomorphotria hydatis]|uniref:Type II secretion system protein H n=1 Tax=Calycomorphotria hydatis TaxID=2528027 RepID=A0A517T5H0_9PLAN|nr:prepilin-type N-terminal cleavage/methylation domain-containing protein [Calycomorphotria hydatis]QDT63626.1 hypothetical protein V22_08500 [Calycomorphotria hydatis]